METLKLLPLFRFAFQVRQHIFRRNPRWHLQVCLTLLKKPSICPSRCSQEIYRQVPQKMVIGSNLSVPAQRHFYKRQTFLVSIQLGTGCDTLIFLDSATDWYNVYSQSLRDPRSRTIKCNQLSHDSHPYNENL